MFLDCNEENLAINFMSVECHVYHYHCRERVDEGQPRDSAGSPQFIEQKSDTSEDSMIKIKAYKPVATVSVKPLSPTSVPVPYDVDEEGDVAWNDYDRGTFRYISLLQGIDKAKS